ncbi:hypothetical protein Acr_00g0005310 [Actinidia rufa]|uniref:Uncharacterized protein n=1 Tax=Actinidia rufa TaxID=165716 RepID=A0A7J0D7R7_9ERIC|nr:hypothetical protein Acr_00g0005310 [Actinidia rufa]
MVSTSRDNGEDISIGGVALVTGNNGESHHSRDEPHRGYHSLNGSVEYIGTLKKEMRKVFPHLPDLTLLRLLGGKVRSLIPSLESGSSSLEACYVEENKLEKARPDGGMIQGCKFGSKVDPCCEEGSHQREMPQEKKKVLTKAKASLSKATSKAVAGEGPLANLGVVLGPKASMLRNPAMAKKLLKGVILLASKEKVVVLASSLAERGRKLREGTMIQYARAKSIRSKEGPVVELSDQEQKAIEELQKMREEQDATVARLDVEMAELKKKAIAEFKASKAVEFTASRYFSKGFDFYKRQINCLHPVLNIQGMGIDIDLFVKEEEEEEEEEEEKE